MNFHKSKHLFELDIPISILWKLEINAPNYGHMWMVVLFFSSWCMLVVAQYSISVLKCEKLFWFHYVPTYLQPQVGKSACIVLAKERHSKGERVPFSAYTPKYPKLKPEAANTLSLMFQIFLEKNYRTPWYLVLPTLSPPTSLWNLEIQKIVIY